MNILILGSGGREHALSWKIKQSPLCNELFIAPGNAGTGMVGTNIAISATDFNAVKSTVLERKIEMVIVGPEAPLVEGIYDFFQGDEDLKNVMIIGPSQAGATLEGSKAFAKEFMMEFDIPTAAYKEFSAETLQEGLAYIDANEGPYVLKADGLAAGKGVLILDDASEAKQELAAMLGGKFGEASAKVVIEQFLSGLEFSVFALTNGKDYKLLPVAKDYKRIGEGDTGLNTGGMGAVSHPPFVDAEMMAKVEERIVKPTIKGLGERGLEYIGFVFFGLIEVNGDPYVIEYNCRMGDPETEVVMPRIKSDLVPLLEAAWKGNLGEQEVEIEERSAVTVFMVSGGYPEKYEKGKEITGLENVTDSIVFHAGTKEQNGKVLSNGGRVLAVTSYGSDFKEALATSYESIKHISFEKHNFRTDIGFDLK